MAAKTSKPGIILAIHGLENIIASPRLPPVLRPSAFQAPRRASRPNRPFGRRRYDKLYPQSTKTALFRSACLLWGEIVVAGAREGLALPHKPERDNSRGSVY